MFGLTMQERTAEAIRRGALAAMTGAYFHHSKVPKFGLNDAGSGWLYSEALAHLIYTLNLLIGNVLGGEKWATPEFFFKAVAKGVRESERELGLAGDSVLSFVIKRVVEMDALSSEQRTNGEHLRQSVALIQKMDPSANGSAIAKELAEASIIFFQDARKMFGV
jgi:hypothetical protein